MRRGAALYGMGRMQEALQTYEAGLRIDPTSAQMAQAAADVRQHLANGGASAMPPAASSAASANVTAAGAQGGAESPARPHSADGPRVSQKSRRRSQRGLSKRRSKRPRRLS